MTGVFELGESNNPVEQWDDQCVYLFDSRRMVVHYGNVKPIALYINFGLASVWPLGQSICKVCVGKVKTLCSRYKQC